MNTPTFALELRGDEASVRRRGRIEETTQCKSAMRTFRGIGIRITLVALAGFIAGCDSGVSDSDVRFIAATMPPQFESLRMYSAIPESGGQTGAGAHGASGLQQGCMAIIRSGNSRSRETVILDSKSAGLFDLEVVRTSNGWSVTSDGLTPPSDNSAGFRTQFMNCVSAIEDKFRAEPEKVE